MDILQQALKIVDDRSWVRVCMYAATTVALYDQALSLPDEIRYIWKRQLSHHSILYILVGSFKPPVYLLPHLRFSVQTRHLGSVVLVIASIMYSIPIGERTCYIFLRWHAWAPTTLILLMQGVLIANLSALYHNSRRLLLPILGLLVLEIAVLFTLLIIGQHSMTVVIEPFSGVHVCQGRNIPQWAPAFWIPVVVVDFMLSLCALPKSWRHFQETRHINQSIMKTVFRDSFVYYLAILVINTANGVVWQFAKHLAYEIPQCFTIAISSVLGCRMILNMRAWEQDRRQQIGPNLRLSALDNIVIGGLSPEKLDASTV